MPPLQGFEGPAFAGLNRVVPREITPLAGRLGAFCRPSPRAGGVFAFPSGGASPRPFDLKPTNDDSNIFYHKKIKKERVYEIRFCSH